MRRSPYRWMIDRNIPGGRTGNTHRRDNTMHNFHSTATALRMIPAGLAMMVALGFMAEPAQTHSPQPAPDRKPTLFLVGDSTVRTGTKGQQGWGDPIIKLFDSTKIKVENRAIGGRSSRTFQTEGRWEQILNV